MIATVFDWRQLHLWVHAIRFITWKLNEIEPTPFEIEKLEKMKVYNPVLRSYLVWRRTLLFTAIPSLIISSFISFIQSEELKEVGDSTFYNVFGKFTVISVHLASPVLAFTVILALCFWKDYIHSTRYLWMGWLTSVALPLWPAIFPIDYLLTKEIIDVLEEDAFTYLTVRIAYAIQYAIQLLPIILSLPGGTVKAALKIRGLLPDLSLAGWILVMAAQTFALLELVILVLVSQILGTGVFLVGMILIVLSPLIYVWRQHLYTQVNTAESEKVLDRTQLCIKLVGLTGTFFILIWAFVNNPYEINVLGLTTQSDAELDPVANNETYNDYINALDKGDFDEADTLLEEYNNDFLPNAIVTYDSIVLLVLQYMGRSIVTSLVFADVILYMTMSNWNCERVRQGLYTANNGVLDPYINLDNELKNMSMKDSPVDVEKVQDPGSEPEVAENVPDVETLNNDKGPQYPGSDPEVVESVPDMEHLNNDKGPQDPALHSRPAKLSIRGTSDGLVSTVLRNLGAASDP